MLKHPKIKERDPIPKKAKLILSIVFIIATISVVVLTSGILSTVASKETGTKTQKTPAPPGYFYVTYVYDGDTLAVNMDGNEEKIRMIGVDTPETVKPNSPTECYGKKASDFLKNRLNGKYVRLESDAINQNRDRYDRLLRYVFDSDGILVNKQIIEEGYGFAYLSFPFTKSEEFRLTQVKAREQSKGVWGGECNITDPDGTRPKTNQL